MRAHLLRSLSKVGLGALTAALAVAASGSAEAASSAKGTLSELSLEVNKGLPTTINSGEFGIDAVKMSVFMAIDPVKGAGPMMKVDIPKGAVLEAHWTPQEKGRLKIKSLLGASNDGTPGIGLTHGRTVPYGIRCSTCHVIFPSPVPNVYTFLYPIESPASNAARTLPSPSCSAVSPPVNVIRLAGSNVTR
jgi:hypothetical protein